LNPRHGDLPSGSAAVWNKTFVNKDGAGRSSWAGGGDLRCLLPAQAGLAGWVNKCADTVK